jgi:hypothetical protein
MNLKKETETEAPTPKWIIFLGVVLFVGSAAWGGWVLAKNAEQRGATKSANPYEDRSLFGR